MSRRSQTKDPVSISFEEYALAVARLATYNYYSEVDEYEQKGGGGGAASGIKLEELQAQCQLDLGRFHVRVKDGRSGGVTPIQFDSKEYPESEQRWTSFKASLSSIESQPLLDYIKHHVSQKSFFRAYQAYVYLHVHVRIELMKAIASEEDPANKERLTKRLTLHNMQKLVSPCLTVSIIASDKIKVELSVKSDSLQRTVSLNNENDSSAVSVEPVVRMAFDVGESDGVVDVSSIALKVYGGYRKWWNNAKFKKEALNHFLQVGDDPDSSLTNIRLAIIQNELSKLLLCQPHVNSGEVQAIRMKINSWFLNMMEVDSSHAVDVNGLEVILEEVGLLCGIISDTEEWSSDGSGVVEGEEKASEMKPRNVDLSQKVSHGKTSRYDMNVVLRQYFSGVFKKAYRAEYVDKLNGGRSFTDFDNIVEKLFTTRQSHSSWMIWSLFSTTGRTRWKALKKMFKGYASRDDLLSNLKLADSQDEFKSILCRAVVEIMKTRTLGSISSQTQLLKASLLPQNKVSISGLQEEERDVAGPKF